MEKCTVVGIQFCLQYTMYNVHVKTKNGDYIGITSILSIQLITLLQSQVNVMYMDALYIYCI